MKENQSLYEFLLEQGVPADEMSSHESDLYVLYTEDRMKLLEQHYEYFRNIDTFHSPRDSEFKGKVMIDIPFGYMPEHAKAKGIK